MKSTQRWLGLIAAAIALVVVAGAATAQTVLDSAELYPGEKALYEAARKEGMVVSFDTGPTWANWAAEFAAFKKRYPRRLHRAVWNRRQHNRGQQSIEDHTIENPGNRWHWANALVNGLITAANYLSKCSEQKAKVASPGSAMEIFCIPSQF